MSLVATYDLAGDALYIYARPGVSVVETVQLDQRVMVDRDADGIVIGVELLSAARQGIPTGLLADALGREQANEQEIADVALRAIRDLPSPAELD